MTRFRLWGPRAWRLLALGFALALGAGSAGAQGAGDFENEPVKPRARPGFDLFGVADFALTGLRQGGRSSWKTTASGPSDDDPGLDADLSGRVIGTVSSRNGYCCGYFELQLWMAAARGDWLKNRDRVPSLENVKGGGWSTRTQLSRWVSDQDAKTLAGRDGSIGDLFSGITSTADGTCRDNTRRANAVIDPGQQLLAGSDCPPTWAQESFAGERVVEDTTWLRRFREAGNNFDWYDYRVPSFERNPTRLYGSFQTFGATNDFGREVMLKAGNVIPGGAGPSKLDGYPLGVEWEWNVWTYAVPTIGDAMFYKARIINKSARVYGTGIDYDSLFLGFTVRPFHTTGTQSPAMYADLARGTVLSAQTNVNNVGCHYPPLGKRFGTNIRSCLGNNTANRGFNGGGGAIVILNSPIGDLRNKKFTDPQSPFYAPTHPRRGDTITFNLATSCGFTCATQQITPITPGHARAAYGAIVGSEADALGGRGITASELTDLNYHNLFRNPDFPRRWSPATGNVGGFARYVPPSAADNPWDYDRDGTPDTLKVTTCWTSSTSPGYTDPPANGCVPAWADTLPGGAPNSVHNNYWAGVGPIKLRAGDTTEFTVAFVSTPDSISLEGHVNNVISLYQSFWLSPQPPAPVQIVSATTIGGNRQYNTEVRLFFDDAANAQTDRFLLDAASKLRSSVEPDNIRLRVLNPQLVNDIRARALPVGSTVTDTVPRTTTANASCGNGSYDPALCRIVSQPTLGVVDSLFVFKSCDGGITYTATGGANCLPAPANDVGGDDPSGYSWQAYARLGRVNGQFPSQFRDGSVTGGITYTYVVVGQSYPAVFTVLDSIGGSIATRTYVARPKTQNGLTANTANRNVATVYVPASYQAGSDRALVRLDSVTVPGLILRDTSSVYSLAVRLQRPIREAAPINGRLIFSDSAEVTVYDSDSTTVGIDSTVVRLFSIVADSLDGATVRRQAAGRELRFVAPGTTPVDLVARMFGAPGSATATAVRTDVAAPTAANPNAKRTIYSFRPTGATRPQVTVVAEGIPYFVTDSVVAGQDLTPTATLARNDFPGVLFTFDPTRANALRATFWGAPGIPLLRADATPTIRWLDPSASARRDPAAASRYRVRWLDSEFGPAAPFTYDPRNPAALRSAYAASIVARADAQSSDNSAATASVLAATLGGGITADSLAQVTLPFTVRNLRQDRDVTIAILRSDLPATALLGTGGDTVRVNIPEGHWVPGTRLYFIERLPTVAYDTLQASPLVRRVRRTAAGVPDTITVTRVTWGPTVIGCDAPATCNPLIGFAANQAGYTETRNGLTLDVEYFAPVTGQLTSVAFTLEPERVGAQVATVSRNDLSQVRVVPNPYMMYSEYEQTAGTKRLLFTNLPPRGIIRIYTASGQFVQQLTWQESDLEKNCTATTTTTECTASGDLPWNMRTRENLEVGPGFYVFVVSTTVGGKKDKLGKFVIIH